MLIQKREDEETNSRLLCQFCPRFQMDTKPRQELMSMLSGGYIWGLTPLSKVWSNKSAKSSRKSYKVWNYYSDKKHWLGLGLYEFALTTALCESRTVRHQPRTPKHSCNERPRHRPWMSINAERLQSRRGREGPFCLWSWQWYLARYIPLLTNYTYQIAHCRSLYSFRHGYYLSRGSTDEKDIKIGVSFSLSNWIFH